MIDFTIWACTLIEKQKNIVINQNLFINRIVEELSTFCLIDNLSANPSYQIALQPTILYDEILSIRDQKPIPSEKKLSITKKLFTKTWLSPSIKISLDWTLALINRNILNIECTRRNSRALCKDFVFVIEEIKTCKGDVFREPVFLAEL